ncbi:MAG: 4-hydroxy-tetrahydrodipicolinate synthase [Pseudonocardiales bacterium]|nr:4-hydroxy-tetrahydrodipicolinate synthase [Pseudonocardiales bacterium]
MTTLGDGSAIAVPAAPSDGLPLPSPGVLVPIVTPLLPDGAPDLDSFDRLLDFGIDAGVDGFLVLGSSGEAVALSADERYQVATRAKAYGGGRTHLMFGVVAHGTKDAAADAARLDGIGPDSLLLTAPGGFAMSQTEIAGHFRAVAGRVGTPVVAYEVPTRVGVSLSAELLAELGEDGTIAAVKDSSGDLVRGRAVSEATRHIPGFVRYTGCEQCIDGAILGGYDGAIAGLANVFPEFHVELMRRLGTGDWAGASAVQGLIMRLLNLYFHPLEYASFSAQFFAVVKEALVQRGVIAYPTTSPPLTQADESVRTHVAKILELGEELAAQLDDSRMAATARG